MRGRRRRPSCWRRWRRSAATATVSTWASYENELRGITEHGDRVVVEFRQRMVGAGSGLTVEGDLFQVWTVKDGLATRMAMFTVREQAEADLAE